MDNKYHEKLIVSSSPHMVTKTDTSKIMGTVLIALLPAFAVGIYQFGFRVVTLTAVIESILRTVRISVQQNHEKTADCRRPQCSSYRCAAGIQLPVQPAL